MFRKNTLKNYVLQLYYNRTPPLVFSVDFISQQPWISASVFSLIKQLFSTKNKLPLPHLPAEEEIGRLFNIFYNMTDVEEAVQEIYLDLIGMGKDEDEIVDIEWNCVVFKKIVSLLLTSTLFSLYF